MRKLSASQILLKGRLTERHTLIVDQNGVINDVVNRILPDAEFYEGVLCPGFINAHGHIELSHLKDRISRHRGLDGFIEELIMIRRSEEKSADASMNADSEMWNAGIQAAGDICNNESTFKLKTDSAIRYHNFIELYNSDTASAENTFNQGIALVKMAQQYHLNASLVPHAPYSVSVELQRMIGSYSDQKSALWCIHNQETAAENELFISKTGKIAEFFQKLGLLAEWHQPYGVTSLEFVTSVFPAFSKLLLVHNTFTSANDIALLKEKGIFSRIWFCLCPNANLYIENCLPDIEMLLSHGCKLTIGTDSLASNNALSVWEEIKTIHLHYPQIPVADLLTFATQNGADYFGWNDLGCFEKDRKPGVVLLTGISGNTIDMEGMVRRLL